MIKLLTTLCILSTVVNSKVILPSSLSWAVEDSIPCSSGGGSGVFVKLDIADCTSGPCQFHPDGSYEIGVTLKPDIFTDNIVQTATLDHSSGYSRYFEYHNGLYFEGQEYTFVQNLQVPRDYAGKSGLLILNITAEYPVPDYVLACRSVPFTVLVNPLL